MLLLLYALLLLILTAVTYNQSKDTRRIMRVGYNYLFVLITQIWFHIPASEMLSFSETVKLLGKSLFTSVQYLSFNAEIDWADQMAVGLQAQLWIIVFIAATLTVQFVAVMFFGRLLNQLKLKLIGPFRKTQYIIMGRASDAKKLVADIQRKSKECCSHKCKVFRLCKRQPRNPYIIYIPTQPSEESDLLYDTCRIETKDLFERLRDHVKYHIVLLPDTGYSNFDILYQLEKSRAESRSKRKTEGEIKCETDGQSESKAEEQNKSKAENQNESKTEELKIKVTAFLDNDIIRFADIHMDEIDSYLVSKEQLLIQHFFNGHMPIDILKATESFDTSGDFPYLEKPFDLCVIGFGSIGREFLLTSFENSAFLTKDGRPSFKALVIDEELTVKKEKFYTDVPYFESSKQIDFVDAGIHTPEYFNAIESRLGSLKQILISTEDTQLNIEAAFKLYRYFDRISQYDNRPEIIVVVNDSSPGVEYLLKQYPVVEINSVQEIKETDETNEHDETKEAKEAKGPDEPKEAEETKEPDGTKESKEAKGPDKTKGTEKQSEINKIKIINLNDQIINYETLVARRTDVGAKAINEQYNEISNTGSDWNKLGTFTQTSNRVVERDKYNKKVLAECCKADIDLKRKIALLAQYEHLRWNAFHHARGWRVLPVSELTDDEIVNNVSKRPEIKRHICLVSWDELDALYQTVKEKKDALSEKKKDKFDALSRKEKNKPEAILEKAKNKSDVILTEAEKEPDVILEEEKNQFKKYDIGIAKDVLRKEIEQYCRDMSEGV